MKKIYLSIGLLAGVLLIFSGCSSENRKENTSLESAYSEENQVAEISDTEGKVTIYFFWGDGCPHCATEKPFLDEMKRKYPDLAVKEFETWKSKDNAALFQEMAKAYGTTAQGVPTTFIGEGEPFVGFSNGMKAEMEARIKLCVEQDCTDPGTKL